jgi:hypothetical protein
MRLIPEVLADKTDRTPFVGSVRKCFRYQPHFRRGGRFRFTFFQAPSPAPARQLHPDMFDPDTANILLGLTGSLSHTLLTPPWAEPSKIWVFLYGSSDFFLPYDL